MFVVECTKCKSRISVGKQPTKLTPETILPADAFTKIVPWTVTIHCPVCNTDTTDTPIEQAHPSDKRED